MTSETRALSSFQSRVDAVFGALQTTTSEQQEDQGWSLSKEQVYRVGKEADYSSEEEEQAKEGDARRRELLPGSLLVDLEGDENSDGEGELPSNAFCRALENEEEYDANDALASGVVEHSREKRPPRHTEVLDDNVFERASKVQNADHTSKPAQMEIDQPRAASQNQPTSAGTSAEETGRADSTAGDTQGTAKRVRFSEPWMPPHQRGGNESSSARNSSTDVQPSNAKPPLAPAHGRRSRGRGQNRSFVPDHIRHPEKYIAYVLDEPITVGSGDSGSGSADNGRAEMLHAARSAQAAATASPATAEPAIELPSFGASIAFVPQGKRGKAVIEDQPPTKLAAGRVNQGMILPTGELETDDSPEGLHTGEEQPMGSADVDAMPAVDFQAKTRRRRNLRGRLKD